MNKLVSIIKRGVALVLAWVRPAPPAPPPVPAGPRPPTVADRWAKEEEAIRNTVLTVASIEVLDEREREGLIKSLLFKFPERVQEVARLRYARLKKEFEIRGSEIKKMGFINHGSSPPMVGTRFGSDGLFEQEVMRVFGPVHELSLGWSMDTVWYVEARNVAGLKDKNGEPVLPYNLEIERRRAEREQRERERRWGLRKESVRNDNLG